MCFTHAGPLSQDQPRSSAPWPLGVALTAVDDTAPESGWGSQPASLLGVALELRMEFIVLNGGTKKHRRCGRDHRSRCLGLLLLN